MKELPITVGPTMYDHLSWRWDKRARAWKAEHDGHDLTVYFHKLGGRWNRRFFDGTPNPNPANSYWTAAVDGDHPRHRKFATAYEAKLAAAEDYKRRFGQ